jgi:hypothetical protein
MRGVHAWLIKSTRQGFLSNVGHFNCLTRSLMCDIFGQTRVQQREGKTYHCQKNLLWYHVKIHEPYSLSKDVLREEGCSWFIKSTRQWSLSNVGHFNTLVISTKPRENRHVSWLPLFINVFKNVLFIFIFKKKKFNMTYK